MIKPEKIETLKKGLADYNQEQEEECTIMTMDDYIRYSEEEEPGFYSWLFDQDVGNFGEGMSQEQKRIYAQFRKAICAMDERSNVHQIDDDLLSLGLWPW
jgi:hypothetical protein